jgi:exonuclease SbcD
VAAHAFVTGGQASDSERELAVGGLGQVGASTFAGADYVALGHLHGRQQLAPAVRYSGSPLAFSFSEADQVKGSWLVTLDGDGLAGVESVPAPVPRRLARLRGELHQLLHDPEYAGAEGAWCQVTLTDAVRPAMPMEQLRRRFGQVLELRLEPARADGAGVAAEGYAERIAGQGDLEVCCGFLAHVRQRPASGDEQRLMERALGDVVLAELEVATHETAAALDRNRTDGDLDGGLDGDGGFGAELHLVDAPRPRAGRRPRRTA